MLRLALALLATALAATEASACSCVRLSRADVIRDSGVAFSGTVRDVTTQGNQVAMTVQVTGRIKGEPPDQLTVITRRDGAACGYPIESGQARNFAGTLEGRDRMTISLCTMLPLNPRP